MSKTSIHFEACNVIKSELHNSRKQKLDYIFPKLTKNNESLCYVSNLKQREKECRELYESKVGQKMQSKTIPIREGVVVIDEKTTMKDLENLAQEFQKLLGWTPLQIHIHRDEGYIKSPDNKGNSEVAKLNLHAHLVFDCQDKNTGKMCRNTKIQMSQAQDLCANILGMERGESSTRRHLKSLEYKIAVKEENLHKAELEIKKLKEQVNFYQNIFSVSEDEIDRFKIKSFLGSKINKKEIKQLIISERIKTALNTDLNAKNKGLEKNIKEVFTQVDLLKTKIIKLEDRIKTEQRINQNLKKEIENPTEIYLKQKLAEHSQKEKEMFDIISQEIKEKVKKNLKYYRENQNEIDNLYYKSFAKIENKKPWDLMNKYYEGGQSKFEKDIENIINSEKIILEEEQKEKQFKRFSR